MGTTSDNQRAELGSIAETNEILEKISTTSSELLDMTALKGKVSEPGPGLTRCSDRDPSRFFKVRHTWNLSGPPIEDLSASLDTVRKTLPKQGWVIESYGPNKSQERSLTLVANHSKKKVGLNIQLWEENASNGRPLLLFSLTSACHEAPTGSTVSPY
ncbi:hypothetical protein [Streptomyces sp. GSL17-111]|uniref:hypothetical protein n=1 Tax=Streptomyces sp. GSL17-111 TaxID=3121596 RepID=UPI0030F43AED